MSATGPFPIVPAPRLEPEHFPRDLLTVAVFGPGHGEAIFVALPDGRLGVLDGCAEREDPVLALIDRIDLERDAPPRLAFVGMTHPHEDHFAGLGHLLERHFERIDLWWDTPIGNRHAKALYEYVEKTRGGREPLPDDWKQTTLEKIVDQMSRAARERGATFKRCVADKLLLRSSSAGAPIVTKGIGPCDADVHRAQLDLVACIRRLAETRAPPRGTDPNYMSAALVLRWGQAGVLLTGDLLNEVDGYLGWSSAVRDEALSEGPIQVVKCAHHASSGAHHDGLWDRIAPKLALVTPFKRGRTDRAQRKYPPRPEQVAQIGARCPIVITSPPLWPEGSEVPRPHGHAWSTVPVPDDPTGARTDTLDLVPREGRSALNNAVAVTLDATGDIVQVVLAGEADFYGP